MSWITLSILSTLLWAVSNVIDKYLISRLINRPIVPVIINSFIGLLFSLGIFLSVGVGDLSIHNIFLALFTGPLYALIVFLYFHAAKSEEISRVVPVFYLTAVFTLLIAAVFLGEIFSPIKYLGILLLVIGAILISSKNFLSLNRSRGFWFIVLAAFLIAINSVIIKYLLNFADFWTIFTYGKLGTFIAVIPATILNVQTVKTIYKERGFAPFGFSALSESLTVLGGLAITIAISIGFVTLVNALSSIQPFFVLLFTILISLFYPQILREELGKSVIFAKLVATAMMFIGALIVSQ